jgi:benzoyl-CoA reductase/2-hydroxyglutaryl-CoA dehydratase subunit BcrC/BadD/HgdB
MEGKLDFLDCIVLSNTCDAVRKLYDMWSGYVKGTPVYLINNPQKLMSESNREYYLEELERFGAEMARLSGKKFTDIELEAAIDLYNETRALLQELFQLRKQDPPPLSGEEFLEISMAASIMPKDRANRLLKDLLEEIKARIVPKNYGPRILVTGSIMDNPVLLRMVEEVGGIVAADDLCTTSRYFWGRIEKKSNPLLSLYSHLNTRPLCACMHPIESRIDHILELVDEFRIEAVIHFSLKYCHPFLYEAPLLQKKLETRGIPFSILETGHDLSGLGQLRTRIQAFVEMIDL